MVRPAHFGYNPETAANNAFQSLNPDLTSDQVEEKALQEFDAFVSRLRDAGVQVHVVEDTAIPVKPDAIFPNNWVTFHQDGTVATYPMHAPTRRKERREDVIEQLSTLFEVTNRVQFEGTEAEDRFLEGTGSLILDRPNRIAYACLSPRTEGELLDTFCTKMGYKKVAFTAVDGDGEAIYHTNVMMALGVDFVVICLDAVPDKAEQQFLKDQFAATGKAIIEISLDQMMAFAGNMLQVAGKDGTPYLVMSEQAYQSLNPAQVELIGQYTQILHSPLYTIEQHGGGSARCMMAEIFLEEK
jgi:hypothetical protein